MKDQGIKHFALCLGMLFNFPSTQLEAKSYGRIEKEDWISVWRKIVHFNALHCFAFWVFFPFLSADSAMGSVTDVVLSVSVG